MTWSPEQVEILRDLRARNFSLSEMAAEIGVTRNSVASKVHSLGLPLPRTGLVALRAPDEIAKPVPGKIKKIEIRPGRISTYGGEVRVVEVLEVIPDSPLPHAGAPKSLMELEVGQCCWPVADKFCGEAVGATRKSYCETHETMSRGRGGKQNAP